MERAMSEPTVPETTPGNVCRWQECEIDWETECGDVFQTVDGRNPSKHRMEFCCFCGKRLEEVEEEDDHE
jgi:hypothetical protein